MHRRGGAVFGDDDADEASEKLAAGKAAAAASIPMTPAQKCHMAISVIALSMLAATCVVLIYYVVQMGPIITRVNELSAGPLQKIVSGVDAIVMDGNSTMNAVAKATPVLLTSVKGAAATFTPQHIKALFDNVVLILDLVARQNVSMLVNDAGQLVARFNSIFKRDTLRLEFPLL